MSARRPIYPSDLLALARRGILPSSPVAVDTETSGLFVDDGARMSTTSIAFADHLSQWGAYLFGEDDLEEYEHMWDGGIYSSHWEVIDETTEMNIVSFAWPFDQGVQMTGKKEDDGYATFWPDADNAPEDEWVALLEWLALVGYANGLVYHHAKFDQHIVSAGCRRWPGLGRDLSKYTIWDTQNVCGLIYPYQTRIWNAKLGYEVPTTSLKPNAARLWGIEETDEQQVIREYLRKHKLPAGRWDLMPWNIIAKYAEQDARLTIRLMFRQINDIQEGEASWLGTPEEVMQLIDRRLKTSQMLFRVERRGLPFDQEGALTVAAKLDQDAMGLEQALPFSPPTLPQAKKFWFGRKDEGGMEWPPYETTEKGSPQINETIINKMIKAGLPGTEEWRDLQKVRTANERWYSGYAGMTGSDGRLRASVRQFGTVSGRFSVERVQLQAIPHDYRLSAFEVLDGLPTPRQLIGQGVPKGYKMWELDLAQAELRVAALYAGCQTMLDLIEAGADLHGETAKMLFTGIDENSEGWGKMRTIAKRSNFGLIFGSGWETFQKDLEKQTGIRLSDEEAQNIVRSWNAVYPEFKRAIYSTKDRVEARMRMPSFERGVGWVQLGNGERRWFMPGEETHKSFNQRVQPSLAQYGIDLWLWAEELLMERYGDEPIFAEDGTYVGRIGMVMMIHDSMVLLLPDDAGAQDVLTYIQDKAVALWKEWFPGVSGGLDVKEWGKAA